MEYWQSSPYKICSAWLIFITLDVVLGGNRGGTPDEVNKHLSLGTEYLARGELQAALSQFHAAVEGDSNSYISYFKRGTVYLAMGKSKLAILDLNKVLELKPDFVGAKHQRALVLMKQGSLEDAMRDFFDLHSKDHHNEEAYVNYLRAEGLARDIQLAKDLVRDGQHSTAMDILTSIIEACPWSSELRELRSNCHQALHDPVSAILDLRSANKLQSDNTDGYFKLSMLHYQLGQPHESLREVRDCLKLDPDHKDCFPHYKKVKKIDKFLNDVQDSLESRDYTTCISSAEKIIKTETTVPMIQWLGHAKLCKCYQEAGQTMEAISACTDALKINKDADVLCDRADAYLASDMYDDAIRDYSEATEILEDYPRAKEGVQEAMKRQKQSEKRDYYKILNVKRSANKKEIVKAYRKAAQQWHPDNFPDGPEKKKAEKKFIDIAAAKEVLTDTEKRKKFDHGEDPLDPESGQHHNAYNAFKHFHPFNSETPFTFKFHFN